jgi:hypothetical protein
MAARAEEYRWSSAPFHCGLAAGGLLSEEFPPAGVVEDWSAWLTHEDDAVQSGAPHPAENEGDGSRNS